MRDLRKVLAVHKFFMIGFVMFFCDSVRVHGNPGNTRWCRGVTEPSRAASRLSVQVTAGGRGPLGRHRSLCVDSRCYPLHPGAALQSPSLMFGHLKRYLSFIVFQARRWTAQSLSVEVTRLPSSVRPYSPGSFCERQELGARNSIENCGKDEEGEKQAEPRFSQVTRFLSKAAGHDP